MEPSMDASSAAENNPRRSPSLHYVTAVTAFTCSKMRPDGFGGMAILITGNTVTGKSTNDIIEDFLAEAGLDTDARDADLSAAPRGVL